MGAAQVPAHATLRIGATLPVDRSRTRSPCSTLIVLKTSAPLHLLQHMLTVTLQRWTSRELASIITELPHQARDKLLSLLANPKFDARDIIWKNAAQLDVFLDDNAAQVRV